MNVELLRKIIKERDSLELEDDGGIEKCWEQEIEILTQNLDETIAYLDSVTDGDEIESLGEVFEDICDHFKSKKLMECIERIGKRFPNSTVQVDVEYARLHPIENE